jgi:peptidoglycan/LPS O-acetylase OafA/YrhL
VNDHTRLLALDGLRGVAIVLVLVHHLRAVFAPQLDRSFAPGGFLGVDLFFVLSGFLITGLLLNEFRDRRTIRLPSFYRRRLMRLYPALVVLLAAHAVYAAHVGVPFDVERDQVASVLLYYSNWRETFAVPEGTGHLWSLAVEEQFYLVWPLVLTGLLWLTGARRRYVGVVLVAGVAGIALYRAWRWRDGMPFLFIYSRTDTRADALLVGALGAVLTGGVRGLSLSSTWGRVASYVAWLASGVLAWFVLFAGYDEGMLYLGGFTVVAVACGVLVLAVFPGSAWPPARALQWAPLRTLGVVSYGVYLWHLPVFVATQRYAQGAPAAGQAVIACAITAMLTGLSWFLVERPFLQWKSRLDDRSPAAHLVVRGRVNWADEGLRVERQP